MQVLSSSSHDPFWSWGHWPTPQSHSSSPSGTRRSLKYMAQDNGQTWQSPMAGNIRSGEIFMGREFENQPRSLTHSSHSITVRCFLWSQCLLLARLGLFQKGVQAARASWPDQKRAILLAVTGPLGACRILCSRTFSTSQMNQNRRRKKPMSCGCSSWTKDAILGPTRTP